MSLGQQLKPHLPFIRRYARALLGSQRLGDAVVRYVLRRIVDDPDPIYEFDDPRVALYAVFHNTLADAPHELLNEIAAFDREGEETALSEEVYRKRIERVPASSREALLLTALEGFSSEDAALITQTDPATVDARVEEALNEIERQTYTKVLIIEDEPLVAMDLQATVEELGHEVVGIGVTKEEALQLDSDEVGLVLVDVQLADDSSGIDAAEELLARRQRPLIYITAYPERIGEHPQPEPTYLITKPYHRSTVRAAIAQALFFDVTTLPQEAAQPAAPTPLHSKQIVPKPGPINAEVSNGQLRIVDATAAKTRTEFASIEAVRKLHLRTAKHLAECLIGSNAAPRVSYRLDSVRRTLSRPLTEERSLQLGVQARGLEGILSAASELLDDENLADLSVFASDLLELVRQFPNYRQFVDEAASLRRLTDDERKALGSVISVFQQQPDDVVEPALKVAMGDVKTAAEENIDSVSELALVRTVNNIVRAVARFVNRHAVAVSKKSGAIFDSVGGAFIGTSLVAVILGAPVVGILLLLQTALPREFAFISALIRLAKLLL